MKKMLKLLIVVALLAGLGAVGYAVYFRPQAVVWKKEMGFVPIPHCPHCDRTLLALDEACPRCGRAVVWEGKEKLEGDIDAAVKSVERSAKETGEKIESEVEKLKQE